MLWSKLQIYFNLIIEVANFWFFIIHLFHILRSVLGHELMIIFLFQAWKLRTLTFINFLNLSTHNCSKIARTFLANSFPFWLLGKFSEGTSYLHDKLLILSLFFFSLRKMGDIWRRWKWRIFVCQHQEANWWCHKLLWGKKSKIIWA